MFMEEIRSRLKEFESFDRSNFKRVFEELVFCLLTPQSRALNADKAVRELKSKGLLFSGGVKRVSEVLRKCGVRFHNIKAMRIVNARNLVLVFGMRLIYILAPEDARTFLIYFTQVKILPFLTT